MAANDAKFFKGRREMQIDDYHSLVSSGGERRVKAGVRIPMSNRPTKGAPEWVLDGYTFVVKDDSPYDKTSCDGVKMEGMSVSFYTSDAIQRKMAGVGGLNGCTLTNFKVERIGADDKAEVYLRFVIYSPNSKDIHAWFYEHQKAKIFVEFDTTQASMVYGGEEEDEDEDEKDDGQQSLLDPNDNPEAGIADDTRSITPATSKPTIVKPSASKKKPVVH